MEKIMVVNDGTDASRMIFEQMRAEVLEHKLCAEVTEFFIDRSSASGLSSGSGIAEFRGSIAHLAQNIQDTTMLLVHLAPVSFEVLESASQLRYIGSARSSLVNIDVAFAQKHGIEVCFAPGRNARTVAEFTVGMILDVTRHIASSNRLVKDGCWNNELNRTRFNGVELESKTIGLLGMGDIGRNVVNLLSGFGVRVLYYDPAFHKPYGNALWVSLETLLTESDILSLHARAPNAQTILGEQELAHMKRGAYLINTARGYLVNEAALIRQLECGHLGGAALDVFAQEPLAMDSPLLHMDNVLLCPHIGGLSRDMSPRSARFVVEDAKNYLLCQPLKRRAQMIL